MDTIKAPVFKHDRTTLERVEKFVSDTYFTDCNLRGQLYGERWPVKLRYVDCGLTRPSFAEATEKLRNEFRDVQPGLSMSPTWSTHWFDVRFEVPKQWLGKFVSLVWNAGCEAMIWSEDGVPLQGLSSEFDKTDYCISTKISEQDLQRKWHLYVEVAANTLFGAGQGGMINAPDPNRQFVLKTAELAIFRENVFQLMMDLDVLYGLAKHLPSDSSKKYQMMFSANHLINSCQPFDQNSVDECVALGAKMFQSTRSPSIDDKVLRVHAIGNAHIDTAWLWPYAETKRKCARTFSTAMRLMDEYPTLMRFAVSQAQQLDWIREDYPTLFTALLSRVASGHFLPVGGCWVEMDGNLPSGESLVRQMLYGQKFFVEHFGTACRVFWLPDTFGYPSQLPQLMRSAGMQRFVTQKMSWNLVNRFPHNTFWWQGLDGSKVLTHFPPADTYCASVTAEEVLKSEQKFADKGRASDVMLLYGYGDGGGGPDRKMLERLKRLQGLNGCPNVAPSSPEEFFVATERIDPANLCVWSGELYLELHNATYTTHSEIKKLNRESEFLLRDCELLTAMLHVHNGEAPRNWEREWKSVLLNQFHDVLPGTSIADVYVDARKLYAETKLACDRYLVGEDRGISSTNDGREVLYNSLPWPRVVEIDSKLYKIPAMCLIDKEKAQYEPSVGKVEATDNGDGTITIRNTCLAATFDVQLGQLLHLTVCKPDTSEAWQSVYDAIVPGGRGNCFVLYDDVPLYWDAWDVMDYHLETGKQCNRSLSSLSIIKSGDCCRLRNSLSIGENSSLQQDVILRPDQPYLEFEVTIGWREKHKMLKVQFDLNVRASEATYEVQYGHVKRPTHSNTSWDAAKFEVCAHKWVDVSECDFGVGLLNNCKYGHSCRDNRLSLSLARGPTAPDSEADFGTEIRCTYALMPHLGPLHKPETGSMNVIQAAYGLNVPVRSVIVDRTSSIIDCSFLTVDHTAVIIDSIKIAENQSGLIVRMYESHGGKAVAQLTCSFAILAAYQCNILEEYTDTDRLSADGQRLTILFHPFQVKTVFLKIQ